MSPIAGVDQTPVDMMPTEMSSNSMTSSDTSSNQMTSDDMPHRMFTPNAMPVDNSVAKISEESLSIFEHYNCHDGTDADDIIKQVLDDGGTFSFEFKGQTYTLEKVGEDYVAKDSRGYTVDKHVEINTSKTADGFVQISGIKTAEGKAVYIGSKPDADDGSIQLIEHSYKLQSGKDNKYAEKAEEYAAKAAKYAESDPDKAAKYQEKAEEYAAKAEGKHSDKSEKYEAKAEEARAKAEKYAESDPDKAAKYQEKADKYQEKADKYGDKGTPLDQIFNNGVVHNIFQSDCEPPPVEPPPVEPPPVEPPPVEPPPVEPPPVEPPPPVTPPPPPVLVERPRLPDGSQFLFLTDLPEGICEIRGRFVTTDRGENYHTPLTFIPPGTYRITDLPTGDIMVERFNEASDEWVRVSGMFGTEEIPYDTYPNSNGNSNNSGNSGNAGNANNAGGNGSNNAGAHTSVNVSINVNSNEGNNGNHGNNASNGNSGDQGYSASSWNA